MATFETKRHSKERILVKLSLAGNDRLAITMYSMQILIGDLEKSLDKEDFSAIGKKYNIVHKYDAPCTNSHS